MRPNPLARFGLALLLALGAWLWSWWPLLAGLFWGVALKCDDACGGEGWRGQADAWQWQAVAGLGVAAFFAATALVLLVLLRRRNAAVAALVVELGAAVAVATMLSPHWWEHVGRNTLAALATLAAAGAAVGALFLTPTRRAAS
jgi:hypothetical protein